jgi:hypothetical protein
VTNGSIKQHEIENILYGEESKFGYLFPYRKELPKVEKHILSDVFQQNKTLDKIVLENMLNIDYIGWAAKVLLNLDLFPMQIALIQTMWEKPFPMLVACRGGSKTFTLAAYVTLRAVLEQGTKIVIVGAGLRQAKLVFGYIENIWNNSPILREIAGGGKKSGPRQNVDLCYFTVGASSIVALPLGDGQKIRGFRANVIIADEFQSIPEDVFDIVVRGFAATTKSPVDEARIISMIKKLEEHGAPKEIIKSLSSERAAGNQIVYSGTAYYEFNHFYKKFSMWKQILESKGDPDKVAEIFGGANNVPDNFNYKDYAIMRIPHNHLPIGLLDQRQLAHAKAVLPKNIFNMEYGAIFVPDSDGIFPRSLIEACTVGPSKTIATPDGDITFLPRMHGEKGRKYVIGIDPAAERDRLAIIVIEIWPNHYRIVYCWSTNKDDFNKKKKNGLIQEDDYYGYCCAKIRSVVSTFNPIRIEMDSQGGGYALSEMLRNTKLIDTDKKEYPIYEVIDREEPKFSDGCADGPHILHLVQPSNDFNAQANICLHKSFETKRLLFPAFDTVQMYSALMAEKANEIKIDTYEECVNNIEELKNEICTIQLTETATGKDRFDTPTTNVGSLDGKVKKGRMHKDRYTALLMAHKFIYDTEIQVDPVINYDEVVGGVQKHLELKPNEGMYRGPGVGRMTNGQDWLNRGGNFGGVKNQEKL